jgi:diacylglycerol kinase (ATP)
MSISCSFIHSMETEMENNGNGTHEYKEFYIPDYIFIPDSEVEVPAEVPKHPVLVFINSKSGGQLGGELIKTYRQLLNKLQVLN